MDATINALFRGGPFLDTRSLNGEDFLLLFPKEIDARWFDGRIRRLRMPASTDSDGASIPGIAKLVSMILRGLVVGRVIGLEELEHSGTYWPGAFVHDSIYRRKLEEWDGTKWVLADLQRWEADALFRALMFSLGTSDTTSTIIYEALRIAGQAAWDEDRAAVPATTPPTLAGPPPVHAPG